MQGFMNVRQIKGICPDNRNIVLEYMPSDNQSLKRNYWDGKLVCVWGGGGGGRG